MKSFKVIQYEGDDFWHVQALGERFKLNKMRAVVTDKLQYLGPDACRWKIEYYRLEGPHNSDAMLHVSVSNKGTQEDIAAELRVRAHYCDEIDDEEENKRPPVLPSVRRNFDSVGPSDDEY